MDVSFEWVYHLSGVTVFFSECIILSKWQLDAKCVILVRFARFRSKMNTLAFELLVFAEYTGWAEETLAKE